jgi:hypothetical protein
MNTRFFHTPGKVVSGNHAGRIPPDLVLIGALVAVRGPRQNKRRSLSAVAILQEEEQFQTAGVTAI